MKQLLVVILLSIILGGCTSTKYVEVPVDRVSIEYRDRVSIDTVYRGDSIIIREKGDTVFLEKYKYIYKVRELRDTVNVTDTITVVQTVEITKEVNKLYTWQLILILLGVGAVLFIIYKLVRLIKS